MAEASKAREEASALPDVTEKAHRHLTLWKLNEGRGVIVKSVIRREMAKCLILNMAGILSFKLMWRRE